MKTPELTPQSTAPPTVPTPTKRDRSTPPPVRPRPTPTPAVNRTVRRATIESKKCRECKAFLPPGHFGRDKYDALADVCLYCDAMATIEYYCNAYGYSDRDKHMAQFIFHDIANRRDAATLDVVKKKAINRPNSWLYMRNAAQEDAQFDSAIRILVGAGVAVVSNDEILTIANPARLKDRNKERRENF